MSAQDQRNPIGRDPEPRDLLIGSKDREARGLARTHLLASKVSEALLEGGTAQLDQETRFVLESFANPRDFDHPELSELLSQLRSGMSPYHALGRYAIAGNQEWSIRVPHDVMPPGSFTPLIVEEVQRLAGQLNGGLVVDLGCGVGVLGLAAVLAHPKISGVLVDVSAAACQASSRNAERLGLASRVEVIQSSTLEGCVPWSRVCLVVANLPYTPSAEVSNLPSRYRVHTPRLAVDGGTDGLHVVREAVHVLERRAIGGTAVLLQTPPARAQEVERLFTLALWRLDGHDHAACPRPFVTATSRDLAL